MVPFGFADVGSWLGVGEVWVGEVEGEAAEAGRDVL